MFGVKKYKIGLDAIPIVANYYQGAGISKYINNIFLKLLQTDIENQYYFFIRTFRKTKLPVQLVKTFSQYNVKFKKIYLPDKVLQFIWSTKIFSPTVEKFVFDNIDVYFSTTYFTPLFKDIKIISFIYDITPIKSDKLPKEYKESFCKLLLTTINRSHRFITISEYVKHDLVKNLSIPENKIDVVYPILNENFYIRPHEEIVRVLKKYNLDINKKYLLYVGVRGENKNLLTAVKAFCYLVKNYNIEHNFVFVGRPDVTGKTDKDIVNYTLKNNIYDRIKFIGYLPDEDLPAIYSGADVFVFISFYEGFGMPVVEAMSCGCPVVVSNTSSLPEIVRDAGILCSPYDYLSVADGIYCLISNPQLRQSFVEKGLQRSEMFKNIHSVRKIIDIIKNI